MSPTSKGMVLGLANVGVIGACIAAVEGTADAFVFVAMFGSLPGLACGAALGWVAEQGRGCHRGVLLAALVTLACLGVALIGSTFGLEELIWVSCLPTAAGCSVLERWTRPPPPALARAIARE
jgi:hypothetical protein